MVFGVYFVFYSMIWEDVFILFFLDGILIIFVFGKLCKVFLVDWGEWCVIVKSIVVKIINGLLGYINIYLEIGKLYVSVCR